MVIDQRNAGASVTIGSSTYTVDRFIARTQSASDSTAQQSTTAPNGFKNSLLVTIGTGASPASSATNAIRQEIEGFNIADLAWGTASASPVTLSFWVRSSLTGTFGGALSNSGLNRSYPYTYTISSANTWEYKTVTIAGDTSGTWATDNSTGIRVWLDLGVGSTYTGTAGAWAGADYRGATGDTQVVATSGATFYITGVQLEKGQTATSFDVLPYTTELQLCQRYFVKFGGEQSAEVVAPSGIGSSTTSGQFYNLYPVRMRTQPTVSFNSLTLADTVNPAVTVTSISFGTAVGSSQISAVTMNVASGVAANRPLYARTSGTDGFLSYSAEL
jgi:hypothetical protein